MIELYLARHGETDWNLSGRVQGHTDTPLNETGRAQARDLAARVRSLGIPVAALGSSDLSRARETARIVAELLGGLPMLAPDADLRERRFGVFEGLTAAECDARYPDAWRTYRDNPLVHCPPDAEPHEAFAARALAAVRRAADLEHRPVLLVTHGGVLRALSRARCAIPNACLYRARVADGRLLDFGLL